VILNRHQVGFHFIGKPVKIVQAGLDIFNEFIVIDRPIAVDQAVSGDFRQIVKTDPLSPRDDLSRGHRIDPAACLCFPKAQF
jgi:hypothetical protein